MTTEVDNTYDRYTVSGVGPYVFSFRIFDEDELTVTVLESGDVDPATLTIDTHYTVTGENDEDGGSITLTAGAATTYASYTLDIRSNVVVDQPTSIKNQGSFVPSIHETALDRLSRQVQDLARKVRAAFRYPDNTALDAVMATRTSWLSKYLYVNSSGVIEPATSIGSTALTQSVIGETLYPRTAAEIAASVTPTDYTYVSDLSERLGAVNDNSTVCTTAFQNIVTTNKHGAVRLLEGSGYLVRNEVPITGRTHVKGVGLGSTIVFNPTSNNLRLFYGTNLDNVTFSDFAISGNVGSATGKIGLDFMKSGSDLVSRLKVDNVYFESLLYSINREEAQHDVIRDSRFLNTGAVQSGIAIRYVTYLNHGTIDNNDFRGQDMCLRIHGGIAITLCNNTSEENGTSGGTINSQFYFSDVTSITIDGHYGEADRTGAAGGVFRFDNCGPTTLRGMDLHGDIGGTTYSAYFFEFVTPEADVVIESCTLSEILTGFVKVTTNTNNKIIRMKGCTYIDGGSELTTYAAIMAKMSDPTSIELTDIPHLETYDPGNLVDGAGATTTFAVTGVVLGDDITVSFSLDRKLYKRLEWDADKGSPPAAWIHHSGDPAQRSGHGWYPVGEGPDDWMHKLVAAQAEWLPPGTYELCGPKMGKNKEKLDSYKLIRHGDDVVDIPRDFDGIKAWLQANEMEGVVWHHPDGRMAKIKRRDFGIAW